MTPTKVYYINPNSLLVVNERGKIKILYTPFRVQCIIQLQKIAKNTWVYVDQVGCTSKDELMFEVNGELHSYKCFRLVINF